MNSIPTGLIYHNDVITIRLCFIHTVTLLLKYYTCFIPIKQCNILKKKYGKNNNNNFN